MKDLDPSFKICGSAGLFYGIGAEKGIIEKGEKMVEVIIKSRYKGLFIRAEANLVVNLNVSDLNETELVGKKNEGFAVSLPFIDFSFLSIKQEFKIDTVSFVGISFGIFKYQYEILEVREIKNRNNYLMREYIKNYRSLFQK